MIDVKELRIGNYVLAEGLVDNEPSLYQIEMVGIGRCAVMNSRSSITLDWRYANPISITPEWLEKLGFIRSDKTYSYQTSDQFYIDWTMEDGICLNGIYDDIMSNGDKLEHIKYIHQLQNLYYALTGDELLFTPHTP